MGEITAPFEHRSQLESREHYKHNPVGPAERVIKLRWVCSCGHTTNWYVNERRARLMRDAHALDGQQSML